MNTRVVDTAEAAQSSVYYCEVPSDPCAIVMFGASGDLARRKLLPALYDLSYHGCLAPRFRLLGFARTHMSDEDFRQKAGEVAAQRKRRRRGRESEERISEASAIFSRGITTIPRRLESWRSGWTSWITKGRWAAIVCFIWRRRRKFTCT